MYSVHNAKVLDKLKLATFNWSEPRSYYSMVPSLGRELSFFTTKTLPGGEKLLSFWDHIKISKLMCFHHMFIGSYGLIVISSWRGGLGDCVFSFFFLMEFSTPFVSFRSILGILKLKKTKLFMANGLLMLITFFIFRIVMLPALLIKYSHIVNLPFHTAVMRLPLGCQLSIIALFLPQFYWFGLMLKIALRVSKTLDRNWVSILRKELNVS